MDLFLGTMMSRNTDDRTLAMVKNGLDKSLECRAFEAITDMELVLKENTEATNRLSKIVDQKMDKLIDVLSGKDMLPVSSVKAIIFFLLFFVFAFMFGVEALTKLIGR